MPLCGKRDAVFIDIGANIGYFTATALAVVNGNEFHYPVMIPVMSSITQ
jgi:putative Ca2+/H+ antiporter (TMEM165/GDT1 family)